MYINNSFSENYYCMTQQYLCYIMSILFLAFYCIIQILCMVNNPNRNNIYCIRKYYDYSFMDEGFLMREKVKALDCPKYGIDIPVEWYDSFQIDLLIIGVIILLAISWKQYLNNFYKTKSLIQIKNDPINVKYYDIFPNQSHMIYYNFYTTLSQSYSINPTNSFLTNSNKKIIFLDKIYSNPSIKYLDYNALKKFIRKHNSIKLQTIPISNNYLIKKYTGSKYIYDLSDSVLIVSTSKK